MHFTFRVLKAKIRGFEAEGRSIRARINRSSGVRKDQLWCLKRELGNHTRVHLIAYGLLRGVPYSKIETNATSIDYVAVHEVILESLQKWHRPSWPLERVRDLIWPPQPTVAPEPEDAPHELSQVVLEQAKDKNLYARAREFLSRLT